MKIKEWQKIQLPYKFKFKFPEKSCSWKFNNIHRKTFFLEFLFNKVAGLFNKVPVNITKFCGHLQTASSEDKNIKCFMMFSRGIGKEYTASKVSLFEVILVRLFPHSDSIRRDTEQLSIFRPKIRTRKVLNTDTSYAVIVTGNRLIGFSEAGTWRCSVKKVFLGLKPY